MNYTEQITSLPYCCTRCLVIHGKVKLVSPGKVNDKIIIAEKKARKNDIKCSMTNNGNPYENAAAERVNGILKQEFIIDGHYPITAIMSIIVELKTRDSI